MSAYAIYRLPHEDHATLIRQTEGDPVELHSLTELNGKQGFFKRVVKYWFIVRTSGL